MAGDSADGAVGPPAATRDLGWALGTLLRAYLKRVGETVAELPGGARGFQVLTIANGGFCANQAAVAEHLGIDRTVMTYLLDDLEAHKLVRREPDPADRRSRRVVLTAKGRKTLARLGGRVQDIERHVLADLDDAEADQLRTLLDRAARSVGAPASASCCRLPESVDAAG